MSNEITTIESEFKRFELEQRRAQALASSVFFPQALQTSGNAVANAVIIYELASRMELSPFEIAQSVFIIHGKPSFETKFLVARLNQSGLIKGRLRTVLNEAKTEAHCEAIDASTGENLIGATISLEIAKREGWLGKNGSKWQTMPELMLRYRAQSFFINEFFPEVKFGLATREDIIDAEPIAVQNFSRENKGVVDNSELDLNAIIAEPIAEPKSEQISPADKPKKPKYKVTVNKPAEAQGGENGE